MAGSSSVFKVPPLPPPYQPKEFEISRPLWGKCLRKSLCALYTPFVICLASGKLTVQRFRHYLSQNFHFLTASVRALKMLEKYAVADDDKTKLVELRMSALNELKDFNKEWGLETIHEHLLSPATQKYTDLLLETASGTVDGVNADVLDKSKIIHYTLGVLVARLRLFAFLFKEIQDLLNATDENFHREQIDKSLTNFEASAVNTEDFLDKLSAGLTKDEHHVIEKLYHKAIKLQIEFLSVHLQEKQDTVTPLCKHLNPQVWRLLLGFGFELTCTAVDSYASLIEISILSADMAKKNKPDKEGRLSQKSYAEYQKNCDAIRREYKAEYAKLIKESVLTSEKVEGYSHARLSEALIDVSKFEQKALKEAIGSNLLTGIKQSDILIAGRRLIFQDGCMSFLHKLTQNENLEVDVHVLSSFWCQDLLMSAFESAGLNDVNIHANDLYYDDEDISTGHVLFEIECGHDKLTAFEDLFLKEFEDWKAQFSVYIGSSVGDLMCLLKANIGIVIGTCPILRNVGLHFGVSFEPLFKGIVRKQKDFDGAFLNWDEPAGTLYFVSCWAEIQAFLLGFY